MGRLGSSLRGGGSTSLPGYKGLGRDSQSSSRAQKSSKTAYIEIEDDEDEDDGDDVDELANDGVPCSSPYFTQPTQIVGKATQPTQIVDRGASKLPSSPMVPSTPSTAIEVPASSPFQSQSRAKSSAMPDRKLGVASRVGSAMAPAGTMFRPPSIQKVPRKPSDSVGRKGYLDISDDDLLEDYKKHDSSDDNTPTRGDIRPSSFVRKVNSSVSPSKPESVWLPNGDISLNDIRDVRLRHLTGQVYKIVRRANPAITVRACKEALQKDVGWQVSKAVDFLTGRATNTVSSSKDNSASTTRANNLTDSADNTVRKKLGNCTESFSTSPVKAPSATTKNNTLHSFLKKRLPSTAKISANSSGFTSQLSTQNSRTQSSANSSTISIDSTSTNTNNNQPLRRRRLVQGRKNSPAPSAIFSIPSSPSSSLTTPIKSRDTSPNEFKMNSTTVATSVAPKKRLRRRQDGKPISIALDSDSEQTRVSTSDKPTLSRKRRSDSEQESQSTKKPKLEADKPQGKLRKRKSEERSDPEEVVDPSSPPSKKVKTGPTEKAPSPIKITTPQKRKAIDEPEYETPAESDFDEADTETPSPQLKNVLDYLNTCTVEALSRMIGSTNDAKLMLAARPFESITDAEKVSRLDKSKAKAKKNKARRIAIGENIVEKLTSWLEACEAATAVINECDKRGNEIKSDMSAWSVDYNGLDKTDTQGLIDLPIGEKPEYMDESVQLKPYQLVGLNWMSLLHSKGYSGILADDMGLGKTCQVISFIAHLIGSEREPDTRDPWPNLIVVPPSTYENWMSEFEKFAPEISVLPYSGRSRRDIIPEEARDYHVVLTTYPQVEKQREDLRWLQKIDPYAAIFDEGHRLKNQEALIYKQMMHVPTEWRLILSGTPVQNNLKELLTLLRFIEPSLFEEQSFETLNTIFEAKVTSKDVLNFAALASERVDRARAVMAPFILQRRKEDVLDLAKKTERLEVVGMHNTQKEIYDSIVGKYLLPNGVKSKDAHSWMQLRKAANHHQLFRYHFNDKKVEKMVEILWKNCSEEELGVQNKADRHKARLQEELMNKSDFQLHLWCKDFERYIGHLDIPDRSWEESPKVQKLLELVRGYMKTGDRVLVFSRFEMVVDILRETLHYADIPYCCLTGNTDTATRFPECQRFTNNPDIPVFLLTTGAGGTGLNLTAANKIILFDQSDNPQDDVQASNRAHRIGQTRDVEVIRFITEKSVEGLIYNSCVKKLVLAARVENQFDAEDEEESVEEQCKKRMLLGDEIDVEDEVAPSTQQA